MPPKRSAPTTAESSKKTKQSHATTVMKNPFTGKASRWSRVSVSANADASCKNAVKESENPYAYICVCRSPLDSYDDDDDDDDSEADDDDGESSDDIAEKEPKTSCDGGKKCLCNKPAADHPDHPWILSYAGREKWLTQHTHLDLRCPDLFEMSTFNDHAGYGALEVVQNLLLDFHDTRSNWQEQWAVCEAIAMLYMGDGLAPMQMIEADDVYATTFLIGLLFLDMLSRLEHLNLLQPDSQIRNLGTIMALYIKLAADADIPPSADITTEIKTNNPSTPSITFRASEFPAYILAYARKHNITLTGPADLPTLLDDLDDLEIVLPDPDPAYPTDSIDQDTWYLVPATALYARKHASYPNGRGSWKSALGGDDLDITSCTSKDRKECSFDGKDPLGKEEIAMIKKGMVLAMA